MYYLAMSESICLENITEASKARTMTSLNDFSCYRHIANVFR